MDSDIWSHASASGAVLITKDEDFVTMRALNNSGPAVVWVRLGNMTTRALLAHFTRMFLKIIVALQRSETIIEISNH